MTAPAATTDSCDYCGLPLAAFGRRPRREDQPAPQRYCCLGCRWAAEVARERQQGAGCTGLLGRLGLATFLTLNVLVFTMALWTSDVYQADAAAAQLDRPLAAVFRYLSLLLTLPVLWLLLPPLAESAWEQLRRRTAATDLLLLAGVVAATAFSAVSVFRGTGPVYFEIACVVLLAVTLGRWFEATGKAQANRTLDALERLLPSEVVVVRADGDRIMPADQLRPGDVIRVVAGERFAADGVIRSGIAAIDEQLITGESQPAVREPGDRVLAGTLNLDGHLLVATTATVAAGALGQLLAAVRAARLSKGPYARLAEQAAAWFLPLVFMAAIGTLAWHWTTAGFEAGLLAALAVVLIACPCALGLATPLAAWCATAAASRVQVLVRHGEALERLARVRTVLFDKTGTLTTHEPRLEEFAVAAGDAPDLVLATALTIATGSRHPLCTAIRSYADSTAIEPADAPRQVRSLPGRGLIACDATGRQIALGSLRLMENEALTCPESLAPTRARLLAAGTALCAIGWQGQIRGLFGFAEALRPEAARAIAGLKASGLQVAILTGDHPQRAERIGQLLGVPASGGLLPDDKVAAVRAAQGRGPVAMVGDGINDAPALAAADVGIALGCGADLSRTSADVCLLADDLARVGWVLDWSRRTVRVMRQNLFWSLVYNALGIALAASGLLNPIWAAAAMVISSVLVVGNSLRLQETEAEPGDPSPDQTSQPRLGEKKSDATAIASAA